LKLDLATLKKRFQTHSVLAVTLESGRIAVDLLRRDEGGSNLMRSFTLPVGAEAVIADAEKTGQLFAEQLAAAGIRERKCVVCLPAGWALTTSTDVPDVEPADLRGYLELRAEREFPIPVSDLRIAHCSYTLPDGKMRATLAALPTKRAEAVERMLAAAGWRGTAAAITAHAIARFTAVGLAAGDLLLHCGPAICGRCYEVSPDVYGQLTGRHVESPTTVDLRALITDQARGLGVRHLSVSPMCTRCNNDLYFSHRAGDVGRQLGIIVASPTVSLSDPLAAARLLV